MRPTPTRRPQTTEQVHSAAYTSKTGKLPTKSVAVTKLLSRARGATLAEMTKASRTNQHIRSQTNDSTNSAMRCREKAGATKFLYKLGLYRKYVVV